MDVIHNQNDPPTELSSKTHKVLLTEWDQCSGTRRANCLGRHFLAYFFVAADKEVSRHKGEKAK